MQRISVAVLAVTYVLWATAGAGAFIPSFSGPDYATPALAVPGSGDAGGMLTTMQSMPQGTVTFMRSPGGAVKATFALFGLTPGSTHEVDLQNGRCPQPYPLVGRNTVAVGGIAADGHGRVKTSLDLPASVLHRAGSVALTIRLGIPRAMDSGVNTVAAESLACTQAPTQKAGSSITRMLTAESRSGASLDGMFSWNYEPQRKTLTVGLYIEGLIPQSRHAAHIHSGSCLSQGPVLYMLPDLRANSAGRVETILVVKGVASPPPSSGWYLNLHQGDSESILVAGKPALSFRPLLCGDFAG